MDTLWTPETMRWQVREEEAEITNVGISVQLKERD